MVVVMFSRKISWWHRSSIFILGVEVGNCEDGDEWDQECWGGLVGVTYECWRGICAYMGDKVLFEIRVEDGKEANIWDSYGSVLLHVSPHS